MRLAVLAGLLLAGCGSDPARPPDTTAVARALDAAAIRSGQLPDVDRIIAAGAYAADTDVGHDRLCVGAGERGVAGLSVSYGTGGTCRGSGSAERSGAGLRLELGRGCRLDATLDERGVTFPGVVPAGCARLCSGRASLAGVRIPKISDSLAEADALTGVDGRPLCPDAAARAAAPS